MAVVITTTCEEKHKKFIVHNDAHNLVSNRSLYLTFPVDAGNEYCWKKIEEIHKLGTQDFLKSF